jgi:DNA (cytosine-5)-methyltransferase 1
VQKGMIQTLSTTPQSDLGVVVAVQLQAKDRDYNKKGKQREERFEPRSDELSNAVLTNDIKNMVTNNLRIRKLTPLETWRLMGFTDDDFAKAEQHHSNSALYKQAGNSIVVQVLEHILKGVFHEPNTI